MAACDGANTMQQFEVEEESLLLSSSSSSSSSSSDGSGSSKPGRILHKASGRCLSTKG